MSNQATLLNVLAAIGTSCNVEDVPALYGATGTELAAAAVSAGFAKLSSRNDRPTYNLTHDGNRLLDALVDERSYSYRS